MNSWYKYASELYKLEKRFLPSIGKAVKSQISSFKEVLQSTGAERAIATISLSSWNDELIPILQNLYKVAGLQGARRSYSELKSQIKTGVKFRGMGRNEIWVAAVIEYLKVHLLEKAVIPISETTREHILQVISQGLEEGWSVEEMVKRLEDERYIQSRARMIVRTEVVRAANVGHRIGARTFPYEVTKKWLSAQDHRTRHSHRYINNQVVDEDGLYRVQRWKGKKMVGYDMMNAPGDPNASAENVINCRCRIIFEPKRDPQGRLILRQTPQLTAPTSGVGSLVANTLLTATVASILQEALSD